MQAVPGVQKVDPRRGGLSQNDLHLRLQVRFLFFFQKRRCDLSFSFSLIHSSMHSLLFLPLD